MKALSRVSIFLLAVTIGLAITVISPAGAQQNVSELTINEHRKITFSTDGSVSASAAAQLAQEIRLADKIISEFLGVEYDGNYRVDIGVSYITSRALLHVYAGNRGYVEFPTLGVKKRNSAVMHEITHIIAPNYNRFLAEGLAVYVQEKFQSNEAPPIFGRDLHKGTSEQQPIPLVALIKETKDTAYFWSRKMVQSQQQRSAYFHAGSLVRFLIEHESFGKDEATRLEKFKRFYGLADRHQRQEIFEAVYGVSLVELESMWRSYIKNR
jgi:hypothetical protein